MPRLLPFRILTPSECDPVRAMGPEGGKVDMGSIEWRLEGTLAATGVAVLLGARIVRTHDVPATRRAVMLAEVMRGVRRAD